MSYNDEEIFGSGVSDDELDEPLEPLEKTDDFGYEEEDPDKDH